MAGLSLASRSRGDALLMGESLPTTLSRSIYNAQHRGIFDDVQCEYRSSVNRDALSRDLQASASWSHLRFKTQIAGNKYRLVTSINYRYGIVFLKFVATHKQYDTVDAQTVEGHHGH